MFAKIDIKAKVSGICASFNHCNEVIMADL